MAGDETANSSQLISTPSLPRHPAHERLYHTTWVYALYSLRTAVWVLLRPTRIRTEKELRDGSYGFSSLSEKTIESLTICWCHKKGRTFSSQFIINLHNSTFSLSTCGSQERNDRSRSTQSIAFMSNAARNWYFCFFIAYRSFCREKRRKRSAREASRGRASSCSFFLVVYAWPYFQATEKIVTVPRDWKLIPRDHYLATWRSQLFGNPLELPVDWVGVYNISRSILPAFLPRDYHVSC